MADKYASKYAFYQEFFQFNQSNPTLISFIRFYYQSNSTYAIESYKCIKLNFIAIISSLLFIASLIINSLLLFTFIRNKELRVSCNIFIIAITGLNLVCTIFQLPFIIASNFACDWIFGYLGCVLTAFLMYWTGCSSIYLMTANSLERFYIICNLLSVQTIKTRNYYYILISCFIIGLFWSTMPLLGWSYYSLEGANTSCSVEWNERSLSVTSYNITIFIFVFLTPVLIICVTQIKIIFSVCFSLLILS